MTNLSEVIHFQQPVVVLDQARRTHCEVWTRVMGYHRPVTSFNTGKQGEFNERLFFNEPQSRSAHPQHWGLRPLLNG